MLQVLAACGNGMGSSLIIKMKIEKILKDMQVDCEVHHASVGQAKADSAKYDLILVSETLAKEFKASDKTHVLGIRNLLSEDEIKSKLNDVL